VLQAQSPRTPELTYATAQHFYQRRSLMRRSASTFYCIAAAAIVAVRGSLMRCDAIWQWLKNRRRFVHREIDLSHERQSLEAEERRAGVSAQE